MKSTIKFLVLTMLLVFALAAFAGCALTKHTWTEATCTAPKTCTDCGITEGEALGHTEQIVEAKAATCYETGLTEGKICSVCNEVLVAQKVVLSLGHDMVIDQPQTATCTEAGLTAGAHCSRCDYKEEQTEVSALGHDMVTDAAVAPTCTATGLTEGSHCSRCDYKVAQEIVPATSHDIVADAAVAPTCTATGLTAGEHCTKCDYKVAQTVVPAAGHDLVADAAVPATCTEAGLTAGEHCTKCDHKVAQTVVPALGHDWVDATVYAPKTCNNCGATEGEALVAYAAIGEIKYLTFGEAFAAAKEGDTIVLLNNVTLDAPIVINADAVLTIDLAGFVLSYESTTMGESMITNKGNLTIKDSGEAGEIFYNYVGANDASYGKGNYTISNSGTLVIDGGKLHIANLSAHAKYVVDNNSTTGDATLIVNGGYLYNYNTSAIRMFCNSTVYNNSVTINGGLVEGYCAIWGQNPGSKTVNGQLTITGGELKSTAKAYVNGTSELKDVSSALYFTIAADGGAWSESSFVKISGGLFNENVYLIEDAPETEITDGATFNGYVLYHIHDFVGLSCETDGVCECGKIKPACHNLTYVAAADATTCLETGHDEYWLCNDCGAYFGDAEASWQLNPAWMFYTGACVRPEDAADCATVPCTLCGNDTYGYGDHDVFTCKGGLCTKCNTEIEGYGCANYDTPACEDGFCSYCGDPVEGFGHENGAWAPCLDGECSYYCGLKYPATEDHLDEDGDDFCDNCWTHLNHDVNPCLGGECSICWTYIEPAHEYFYPCDPVCMNCYEITNPDAAHNIVAADAKAATCGEKGNVAYWYCADCGSAWLDEACTIVTNLRSVAIPATGHNYVEDVIEPTCTKDGYTDYACDVCGHNYTDNTVPALGHKDENGDYKCDKCSTKMLPADGEALTIPQAIAVAKAAGSSYSTQKYYITGIVTGLYNTTYGNLYLKDADGNQICIYGLYSADGSIRYDAMSYKPVNGDELTVYTVLGTYNSDAQGKNAWLDEVVAHEHNYTSQVTDPTCLYDGYTTHTCSICSGSYTDSEVEALGHTTDNGTCERCGMAVGGEAPAEPVTVSKTIKELITQYGWTSSTTKQSFNLDDVVSVKINGGSNTGKAYNGDHIRIYATDSPAGTMTITVPEGYELVSVKISAQTGTYAYFNIDGVSGDVCNKTVDVSGNSVVLKSVKNGSDGKQVRVTAIEVVYKIAE